MNISSSIKAHPVEEGAMEEYFYNVKVLDKTIFTTVTQHPVAVTRWINAVSAVKENTVVRCVGLEIEFDDHINRIGTLQLCVGSCCLIFQLPESDTPLPPSLGRFLVNQNNCFIGVDIEAKLDQLFKQCPYEKTPVRCVDLFLSPVQRTSAEIVEDDWGRRTRLSLHQVLFACVDAFFHFYASTVWNII